MPLYQVLEGKHQDIDGTIYKKGQAFNCDLDLVKLFRGKFTQVATAEDFVTPGKVQARKKKTKVKRKVKKDWTDGLGTKQDWELADENGLVVFKRGAYYHLYEDGDKTPVNSKGLKKNKVTSFIKKWLEE